MHSHYHLLNTHPQHIPKDIRVERDQKLHSPSGQMDGEMFLCKQSLMSWWKEFCYGFSIDCFIENLAVTVTMETSTNDVTHLVGRGDLPKGDVTP